MKFAFYPGCVAKGGCPELYGSAVAVAQKFGIELDEMHGAACTGAGILQEKNRFLGDCLNARTFAMAEKMGLPILTICSTCQGVFSQAHQRLDRDPNYRAQVNEVLKEEGLEYKGTVEVKHILWVLAEEIGAEEIKRQVVRPLNGLRVAPFYGCYLVRPTSALGFDMHPARQTSLETVIEACGAQVVEFSGSTRCCGFPITTINEKNSMGMVAKHTLDAKHEGADAMVTPCPLCHLNLDGFQPKAAAQVQEDIDLPILHLPQMVGMALGMDAKLLGMGRNIVTTYRVLMKTGVKIH